MKIAICIPTGGSIKTDTFLSIFRLLGTTKHEISIFTQTSSILHENRNILVEKAKNHDYILFLDSDMKFEPDILDKLIKRVADIIAPLTYARKLPLTPTCKKLAEGFEIWEEHGDLIKCAGVGTGFLLIKAKVFEKLSKPYFFYSHKEDGTFDYGEDMYFCRKAREAGFDIWLDPSIKVGHLGEYCYV